MSFPLVAAASSSANGWSRALYRPALAAEIGFFGRGTVASLLSGLEAARHVISAAFRSGSKPPTTFDGLFLYITSGAQIGAQRALVDGAFDGPEGVFTLDYPLDAVLQANVTFEISELPAADYQGLTGLNAALDKGLDTLPLVDIVDVAATSGLLEYSFASYPWAIKGVGRAFYPRASATVPRIPIAGAAWVGDAEAPVLRLPFAFGTGTTFSVELLRPASTRIRQDGAWGDATGLTSDSDEALYGVREVVRAAKPFALDQMAQRYRRGTPERTDILRDAGEARVAAALGRWYGGYRSIGSRAVGAR